MWDIAMFANGTIGGSGYNFNISFLNESEINFIDHPCESPYGHHLLCADPKREDLSATIDNGIIVTDKWILTSATACLNIYNNPWNEYFIRAGDHNLTESKNVSAIKNYHIYAKENENRCNQNDDYCLIELETPLVISESIQAIGFQNFADSTTTTTTTDWTTTWDSTWHPGLTTTLTTTTTTTSTTNARRKRQAPATTTTTTVATTTTTVATTTTTSTITTTTTIPATTTTTVATTTTTDFQPEPPILLTTTTFPWWATTKPSVDYFGNCWIAAWSDKNLRTFKADVISECDRYYSTSHIPFRKNLLSTEEKARLRKMMETTTAMPSTTTTTTTPLTPSVPEKDILQSIDEIMEPIGEDYYGRRSHFCIDNLRKVCISRQRKMFML